MSQIFLELANSSEELINSDIGPRLSVTLDTYIASFVLFYCKDIPCEIFLVKTNVKQLAKENYCLPEELFDILNAKTAHLKDIPIEAQHCKLPVLQSAEIKTCIAGLAGVLRFAIKKLLEKDSNHFCHEILGYRGGCLSACSEVSVWTKFCEKDIQNSVTELLFMSSSERFLEIPEDLFRFEEHLSQPVKTHNILKRKQDLFKQKSNKNANLLIATSNLDNVRKDCDDLELNHVYFAGIDCTLADFLMLPCIYLILNYLEDLSIRIDTKLPMVYEWYNRMLSDVKIEEATKGFYWKEFEFETLKHSDIEVNLPVFTNSSLYLRDPKRTKIKIKHKEPTLVIEKLKEHNISPIYSSCPSIMDEGLDWHSLPISAHPAGGDLPLSRVDRKCQQVESMVLATMDLAQVGDVIVDFCSGGGHVGILLAYYLPKCQIIMVENKEASLQRARERSTILELDNVFFYQCNLNHFNGCFDLAVTLHACGVATDLVLDKCFQHRAKFVCCPCCYGSIHEISNISYPRSEVFKEAGISSEEYVSLCHYADRTEVDTPSESQGKFCMGLIDTDRAHYFLSRDYNVRLCTLKPPDCTPKSNLLIGIPTTTS